VLSRMGVLVGTRPTRVMRCFGAWRHRTHQSGRQRSDTGCSSQASRNKRLTMEERKRTVNTKEASRSLSYKESSPICERPLPYPLFRLSIGAIVSVLAGTQTARRPGYGFDIGWVPADNQPDRTICC
jgi:hypothetical protein